MRDKLVAKLRPERFTAMSGRMAAIVGYILDERFSDPAISELVARPTASSWPRQKGSSARAR